MEQKSCLEWERQCMQESITQKFRLLEQINNLKSREKARELELQKQQRKDLMMKLDNIKIEKESLNSSY
ncbi:unnamed protein product [Rotaria sordida]|uniref:Uncharacterized protein n=1 Tax=Rotaria sordida TaxID=392033 RepID=A0A814P9S0_9BILA|nr:unnamed protein product [Rotaria sordida]CAF1104815.1 unnamed protein product [Rotaria sordida]CAF3903681.1 unnamed protein product [Rotaria sordida]CAF4095317.1 unnamed protein product [Rotaria sordida]